MNEISNKKTLAENVQFNRHEKIVQTNATFFSYDKETAVLQFKFRGLKLSAVSEVLILILSSDENGELLEPLELAYQDTITDFDREQNIATYTLLPGVIGYAGHVVVSLYIHFVDGSTADSSEKFVMNLQASHIDGIAEIVESYYFDAFNNMVEAVKQAAQDKIEEIGNINIDDLVGPPGEPGKAATIQVGDVTTGEEITVTNSGTETDAIFDFTFPEIPENEGYVGYKIAGTTTSDLQTRIHNKLLELGYTQTGVTLQAKKIMMGTVDGVPNSPMKADYVMPQYAFKSGILLVKQGLPLILIIEPNQVSANQTYGDTPIVRFAESGDINKSSGRYFSAGLVPSELIEWQNFRKGIVDLINAAPTVTDPDGGVVNFYGVNFQRVKSQNTYSYWSDIATHTDSEISIAPLQSEEIASTADFPELANYQGGQMIVVGHWLAIVSGQLSTGELWLTVGDTGIHLLNQDPQNTLTIPVGAIVSFNKILLLGNAKATRD